MSERNDYFKNLNRVEIVLTMACTGRCRHCSEGEHAFGREHVEGDRAAQAIREICENFTIQSLMVFGGEPLLFPEDACKIYAAAKEKKIPKRELITNGFFSRDHERIKVVVSELAQSGLRDILLSVDAFHQETIPLEPVKFFAECARKEGLSVQVHPAWLVCESSDNPYNARTREILQGFVQDGFSVSDGNIIFPEGNAKKYLGQYFDDGAEYVNPYENDPEDIRSVSINPNGDVLQGNIYRERIMDILHSYTVNEFRCREKPVN